MEGEQISLLIQRVCPESAKLTATFRTKVPIRGGLSAEGRGEAKPFKVFSYCPGFTISDLSPHNIEANGAQPTSEGARPMLAILKGERDAEHGGFLHGSGTYEW